MSRFSVLDETKQWNLMADRIFLLIC